MDVTRLRYFVTIADTGHVGRAAELLHISQPALSKAVRNLEREAGVPLLRRTGRGVALTPEGLELATRVRPLLAELAEIPRDLAQQRGPAGRLIRYGSHETFGTAFAAQMSALHGGLAFEHRYLSPEQIPDALADHIIDVGLTYVPVVAPGVQAHHLADIDISIWGRAQFGRIPFADLPFAAPARRLVGTSARPQGLDAWPDERISRRVKYRVTHTQAALELAREGLAVAFIADFLVHLADRYADIEHKLLRIPAPAGISGHRQQVFALVREGDKPEALAPIQATLGALATNVTF